MTFEEADKRYPFDPKAKSEYLKGIAKISAFELPDMRRLVYDVQIREQRAAEQRAQRFVPFDQRTAANDLPEDESEKRFP